MARKKITEVSTVSPVDSGATVFISQLVSGVQSLRRASLADLIAKMTHTHQQSDVVGLNTALSGKAATSHTHTKSQITDMPTTMPNPHTLTIGDTEYDGSEDVSVTLTANTQIIKPGITIYDNIDVAKATFIKMLQERPSTTTINGQTIILPSANASEQDDDIAPAYFFYEGTENIAYNTTTGLVQLDTYQRYHKRYYCIKPMPYTNASGDKNGAAIFVIYDFYKDLKDGEAFGGDDQKNFTYEERPISILKSSDGYTCRAPKGKSGTIALTSDVAEKLDIAQGTEYSGYYMVVNSDGDIVPQSVSASGTTVTVGGVAQSTVAFTSDPQTALNSKENAGKITIGGVEKTASSHTITIVTNGTTTTLTIVGVT